MLNFSYILFMLKFFGVETSLIAFSTVKLIKHS